MLKLKNRVKSINTCCGPKSCKFEVNDSPWHCPSGCYFDHVLSELLFYPHCFIERSCIMLKSSMSIPLCVDNIM
jgi:hypothetical protein